MPLNLHNRKSVKNQKPKRRVGRGNASGAGTYSGRGMKGQRARSGGKGGLKLKGMKANIQNIPKLGGFTSQNQKPETVNLSTLDKHFKAGDKVTPEILKEKGLIDTTQNGVKVLGDGTLSKKLTVVVNKASKSAKQAIEQAGGNINAFDEAKKSSGKKKEEAEKKEDDTKDKG